MIALAASFATTAFAQKHMVQFYGWDSGNRASSFDFSTSSDDAKPNKDVSTHMALNYAYAITDAFQLGGTYKSVTGETGGADIGATTFGLNFFWNVNNRLVNTHVLGFRYWMTNYAETTNTRGFDGSKDDTQTDIVLEYGYRWKVGSAWGFDLTYAPRVAYSISTLSPDAAGADDVRTTALAWDFLKFDLLF